MLIYFFRLKIAKNLTKKLGNVIIIILMAITFSIIYVKEL